MTASPAPTPTPDGDPLDLYLDGLLEGDALRAFEQRLSSDAALRAAVEEHRAIDARVRAAFPAPAVRFDLSSAAGETPAAPAPVFRFAARYLAYAAVIALAVAGGWLYMYPPKFSSAARQVSAGQVFDRLEGVGFKPDFVCTSDEEFNKAVKDRFGQGLLIAAAPNVELIGWAYSGGKAGFVVSIHELILMARVDGRDTIVFMDEKSRDRRIKERPPEGMNVFRAEVGNLVLYELSASDKPVLIDRAFDPAAKAAD